MPCETAVVPCHCCCGSDRVQEHAVRSLNANVHGQGHGAVHSVHQEIGGNQFGNECLFTFNGPHLSARPLTVPPIPQSQAMSYLATTGSVRSVPDQAPNQLTVRNGPFVDEMFSNLPLWNMDNYNNTTDSLIPSELDRETPELNHHPPPRVHSHSVSGNTLAPQSCQRNMECAVCSEVLPDSTSLITHSELQHGKTCGFCGKTFSRRSNLKEHIRIHTGYRPFVCPHCQRGFKQRHRFCRHDMAS